MDAHCFPVYTLGGEDSGAAICVATARNAKVFLDNQLQTEGASLMIGDHVIGRPLEIRAVIPALTRSENTGGLPG
jgi:hypothetical protein